MLKQENFQGSYPFTFIEPTEKELQWLFQRLESLDLDKHFSSTVKDSCEYCEGNKESTFSVYRISTAEITDVPEDEWDSDDRGLEINVCENCKSWTVGDY